MYIETDCVKSVWYIVNLEKIPNKLRKCDENVAPFAWAFQFNLTRLSHKICNDDGLLNERELASTRPSNYIPIGSERGQVALGWYD